MKGTDKKNLEWKALAKEINDLNAEIIAAVRTTLDKAIKLGKVLTAAKKKVGRGHWIDFMALYVKFCERSAQFYMQCYLHRDELKSANITDLAEARRYFHLSKSRKKATANKLAADGNNLVIATALPTDKFKRLKGLITQVCNEVAAHRSVEEMEELNQVIEPLISLISDVTDGAKNRLVHC